MTFSYRKFVRKQCTESSVNFSELSKYKNVNRTLPEDKWGHLSGSFGDFSIKFERSCRNTVTDFGNDTAAQQPVRRLHNLSHHRQEWEMLEIAQEGEWQLPGQQGHECSVTPRETCSGKGGCGGLIAQVSTLGDTGDPVLSHCCGHWVSPVVLLCLAWRAETCCLGFSPSLSSCNLHYHNSQLPTSAWFLHCSFLDNPTQSLGGSTFRNASSLLPVFCRPRLLLFICIKKYHQA